MCCNLKANSVVRRLVLAPLSRVETLDSKVVQEVQAAVAAQADKEAAAGAISGCGGCGRGATTGSDAVPVGAAASQAGMDAGSDAAPASQSLEAPPPWLTAAMAPALVMARHQFDAAVLPHMASRVAFGATTGIVEEIIVSRVGHFTCPVLVGALMLGQAAPTALTARPQAQHQPAQQQPAQQQPAQHQPAQHQPAQQQPAQQQPAQQQDHGPTLRRLVAMPLDPMCDALNGCASVAAVLAAAAAGQLPPVLTHNRLAGAEWVEFAPLSGEWRAARAASGWPAAPVLWFRFVPRADLPPEQAAAGAAALQVLAPGDEADAGDVVLVDEASDDEAAQGQEGASSSEEGGGGLSSSAGEGEEGALSSEEVEGFDEFEEDEGAFDGLGEADEFEPSGAGESDPMSEAATAAGGGGAAGAGAGMVAAAGLEDEPSFESAMSVEASEEAAGGPLAGGSTSSGGSGGSGGSAPAGPSPQSHQREGQRDAPASSGVHPSVHPSGGGGRHRSIRLQRGGRAAADPAPGFEVVPPLALGEVAHSGPETLVLRMRLIRPRAGNVALLRLLRQEDLMRQVGSVVLVGGGWGRGAPGLLEVGPEWFQQGARGGGWRALHALMNLAHHPPTSLAPLRSTLPRSTTTFMRPQTVTSSIAPCAAMRCGCLRHDGPGGNWALCDEAPPSPSSTGRQRRAWCLHTCKAGAGPVFAYM
jgi:hypothetical protein